jgi:hypothetical protein
MLHLYLSVLVAIIVANVPAIILALALAIKPGKDGPALREAAPPRCGHNFSSAAAFCLVENWPEA